MEDLKKELEKKNIYMQIGAGMPEKLAEDGYNPAFGARPMRRIVELVIGDLLSKAILGGELKPGDRVEILPGEGKDEYLIDKK